MTRQPARPAHHGSSNPTVLPITELRMFDTADDPLPIPQCCCCPWQMTGSNYGYTACQKCETRMYTQLNQVERMWLQLGEFRERGTRTDTTGRSGTSTPGSPGNENVLNLVGPGSETPLGWLQAIEDDWRHARGLAVQPSRGNSEKALVEVCAFLRGQLPWACGNHDNAPVLEDGSLLVPDVAGLSRDLARIVGRLKGVTTGEPAPRTFVVRCLKVLTGGVRCGGEFAVGANVLDVRCPGCGERYGRDDWVPMYHEQRQSHPRLLGVAA